MTKINEIYELKISIKGWPMKEVETIDNAAKEIFGSPYWELPLDRYIVIDRNDIYSLLAVYLDEKTNLKIEYMVVSQTLIENSKRVL